MKNIFLILVCLVAYYMHGQDIQSLDTIKPPAVYDNIYSRPIYHDSLLSGFVIFIKKEVKLHKHLHHSEQVVVLDGKGNMQLGDKKITIKKGDVLIIPKNTPHSLIVTSNTPVKVLSTQSPYFDGADRVLVEPESLPLKKSGSN